MAMAAMVHNAIPPAAGNKKRAGEKGGDRSIADSPPLRKQQETFPSVPFLVCQIRKRNKVQETNFGCVRSFTSSPAFSVDLLETEPCVLVSCRQHATVHWVEGRRVPLVS